MDRLTISLDDKLSQEIDLWISERGYVNRSEAVRDLFRAELERSRQEKYTAQHCVACLSYVFNHERRDLGERLLHLQHQHHYLTVSSMHVHLDHAYCLETVILQGSARKVKAFADAVFSETGVHHGKLNLICVEEDAPGPGHSHSHRHVRPSV